MNVGRWSPPQRSGAGAGRVGVPAGGGGHAPRRPGGPFWSGVWLLALGGVPVAAGVVMVGGWWWAAFVGLGLGAPALMVADPQRRELERRGLVWVVCGTVIGLGAAYAIGCLALYLWLQDL